MDFILPNIFMLSEQYTIQDVILTAAIDTALLILLVASTGFLSAMIERAARNIATSITGSSYFIFVVQCYLTWPGVVYHELSHALFAVLSGARINYISLKKQQKPDGSMILGQVSFIPRGHPILQSFQLALSAIAPSVMGLFAMILMLKFVFPASSAWWMTLLAIYAFICLVLHSEMSGQDIKNAMLGLPMIIATLFVIFLFIPIDFHAVFQALAPVVQENVPRGVLKTQPNSFE